MDLLVEEASEVPLVLVYVVKATPFAIPVARKVVLFLASSSFPDPTTIVLAPSAASIDGQEVYVKDTDNSLSATRTSSFTGTMVPGDSGSLTTAAAAGRYIFSRELNKWAKV